MFLLCNWPDRITGRTEADQISPKRVTGWGRPLVCSAKKTDLKTGPVSMPIDVSAYYSQYVGLLQFSFYRSADVLPLLDAHFVNNDSNIVAKGVLNHIVERTSDSKVFMDIANEDRELCLATIGNR